MDILFCIHLAIIDRLLLFKLFWLAYCSVSNDNASLKASNILDTFSREDGYGNDHAVHSTFEHIHDFGQTPVHCRSSPQYVPSERDVNGSPSSFSRTDSCKDFLYMLLHYTEEVRIPHAFFGSKDCPIHEELHRQIRFVDCMRECTESIRHKRTASSDYNGERMSAALSLIRERQAEVNSSGKKHAKSSVDKKSQNLQELLACSLARDAEIHPNEPLFPMLLPLAAANSSTNMEVVDSIDLTEVPSVVSVLV